MFNNLLRGMLVAATVAGGFVGLGTASASAASDIRFVAGEGISVVPVQYRDRHEYRDRYERPRYRDDTCSPRQAVRKAYGLGLDRPRIVRENRRAVVVDGVRRGRLQTVRFANDYGCPVLSVRR